MIVEATQVEQRFELFRGLPEDRYVSAYIDGAPYAQKVWEGPDRVEDAIEVLRTSSLSTYENRRISTGALLFGKDTDPCHDLPVTPPGALRYSPALTSIRTFYRLCDGLQTLALVDRNGFLVEIVDVEEWALPFSDTNLAVPSPTRYHIHSAATLCGGHVCMILTPNGEMKLFANGVHVFRFWDGRWRLTDAERKYTLWTHAVGNFELAERLFGAALNLAEDRRGGLLVVLVIPARRRAVSRTDLLSPLPDHRTSVAAPRTSSITCCTEAGARCPSRSETVARIDGGIVLDRESNLLAFSAILRHPDLADLPRKTLKEAVQLPPYLAIWGVLKIVKRMISFFQNILHLGLVDAFGKD
jgi:hypothetical protein